MAGLLLITLALPSFYSHAETISATANSAASYIDIGQSPKGYALTAQQAHLDEILRALGASAGFKVKNFEDADHDIHDWYFESITLDNLLDNLLRGHNTVLIYEESRPGEETPGKRKLKEIWLIARYEDTDAQDGINIEIELERTETTSASGQALSEEQQYKINTIDDLEGMTGNDVIATLQQTLTGDSDPVVRRRAVIALSDIGGTRVLDALEAGLGDRSAMVRTELAKSYSGIEHQRSMLALGQMLMGDKDARVRQQAVHSLYRQDSPAAYLFVEAALKDRDDNVKETANRILQQWQPPDGLSE